MKRETNKFNIGDKIWVLYIDDLFYEWSIKEIEIETIKIDDKVEYNDYYEEDNCFINEIKAQKECDRRNNEEL